MNRRRAGSKQELAPGIYRLSVSAGHDPATGKRRRPSVVFHGTPREADLELARMLAETGRHSSSAITLWDFIDTLYLPAIEPPELRRRTVDEYRSKLEKYVKVAPIGAVRLDRLDRYAMVSWMRGIKTSVVNKQTQLHIYRALSAALGKAVAWGFLEENLLTKAVPEAPVPDEVDSIALTPDQANDYLDAFAGDVLEPVVVLALAGGFRPSEIYGLSWQDIDFASRGVTIGKGLHQRKGEVWYEDAKSRASNRVVILPKWAVTAIKPHRGVGRICGSLTPNQIAWRYKKHAQASGLKPWCPIQNLRHTSATIAHEMGADWNDLANRLGHTSAKMMQSRYVRRWAARDTAVADTMETLRRASK